MRERLTIRTESSEGPKVDFFGDKHRRERLNAGPWLQLWLLQEAIRGSHIVSFRIRSPINTVASRNANQKPVKQRRRRQGWVRVLNDGSGHIVLAIGRCSSGEVRPKSLDERCAENIQFYKGVSLGGSGSRLCVPLQ